MHADLAYKQHAIAELSVLHWVLHRSSKQNSKISFWYQCILQPPVFYTVL